MTVRLRHPSPNNNSNHLGTVSSHQREQNFGYGDKAYRERDSDDGELLADHSPTKWISRIEKRDPDLCLGRVGAPLPRRAGPPAVVRDGGVGGPCAGHLR
jgi:hypothetical protein